MTARRETAPALRWESTRSQGRVAVAPSPAASPQVNPQVWPSADFLDDLSVRQPEAARCESSDTFSRAVDSLVRVLVVTEIALTGPE